MREHDLVILFGAGASNGAVHVQPEAPPLGADLYNALAKHYPNEWGSKSHLGRTWATQFREDFERTMFDEVLRKIPSLSLLEWHRPVAAFFSRYRVDGSGRDMYSLLLRQLKTKSLLSRMMLGTINYDCLLEQAMLGLGLATDYILDDANPERSIPLAKIHGSCNFVTSDLFSLRAQLSMPGSLIESSFTSLPVDDLEESLRRRFSMDQPAFFPVLGLYSPDKPSIVGPAKLQRMRKILAQRIVAATAVVLIGLKPNPRDPHLWEPIARSNASRIGYVGAKVDYDTLRTHQGKVVHLAETFASGVAPILGTLSA